jgi:hypothetical protein
MPGFELLDLAISLVFLYLLISLFCSVLTEFVEAFLRKRSANLLQGIKEMLNDQDGNELVDKLYNQTMIFSLFKGEYDPNGPKAKNLPSYIPVENFTSALLGILVPNDGQGPVDITKLKLAIDNIPNDKVKTAISEVVNDSCDSVEKAKASIASWYNSSMERVSGWYTRHVKIVGLALGFALAVVFNADTIGVSTELAKDRAMTTAFVAVAQGYAQQPTSGNAPKNFTTLLDEVQKAPVAGLPIGWNDKTTPNNAAGWLLKLIGWLLTATAITLGSSFWFDRLKDLINFRGSLKPKGDK